MLQSLHVMKISWRALEWILYKAFIEFSQNKTKKKRKKEKQSLSEAAPQKATLNALNWMVYRNLPQIREIKLLV